ncbi:MAG: FAD-dependent oxidoreductase, partial [Xanthomonadales bacterium]|nr:FAD-dependent oxidoreductase [Xanthomonadales bacterium]
TLECDALIITTPPEQASTLLADPEVDELISGVEMMPCWALMLVLDEPLFAEHDAAFINQGPLSWVSSQPSRPERPTANAWVLHASPEWSLMNLEKSADEVRDLLLEAARELPLSQPFTVMSAVVHRWRYALARQALHCGAIWLGSKNLALAGDWCHGSRVEGAFLSGIAAAGRIMAAHYQKT